LTTTILPSLKTISKAYFFDDLSQMIPVLAFLALASTPALATNWCAPDLTVDDFYQTKFDHYGRPINKLGGIYGVDNSSALWVDSSAKQIKVMTGESSNSFFFSKYV
jgi:hypothetical protein